MILWGLIVTAFLYYGGYFLIGLFLKEVALKEMGAYYLKVLAIGQVISCLEGVGGGYFRGLGKTVLPSASSIISNIIRVPLCIYLASTNLGINGVWWGISLTAMLRGGSAYVFALISILSKQIKSSD